MISPIADFIDEYADLIFPLIATAFVATWIWLIVRIVNRRERWAKWTLAAAVGVPVLYVASFGPACWIYSRKDERALPIIYFPIGRIFDSPSSAMGRIEIALVLYAQAGIPPGSWICVPLGIEGPAIMIEG
jgi:hypothetical protein